MIYRNNAAQLQLSCLQYNILAFPFALPPPHVAFPLIAISHRRVCWFAWQPEEQHTGNNFINI